MEESSLSHELMKPTTTLIIEEHYLQQGKNIDEAIADDLSLEIAMASAR